MPSSLFSSRVKNLYRVQLGTVGGDNFVKHGFHRGIFRLWALQCDGNKYSASTSSGTLGEAKDGAKVCLQNKQGDDSRRGE